VLLELPTAQKGLKTGQAVVEVGILMKKGNDSSLAWTGHWKNRNMGVWGNNEETVVALDPEHAPVLMKTHSTSETLIPISF